MEVVITINNNQTVNVTNVSVTEELEDHSMFLYYLWIVTVPILFSLIIVIGVIGNMMVVIVLLIDKSMKNHTNILLLNLAIADLMFLLICVPFQAYKYASFVFYFGDTVCKIVQYLLFVNAYVTVYTLVAIATLRYISVVHSHATLQYRTKRNIALTCIVIWLIILLSNIPTLFAHQLIFTETEDGFVFSYCGVVQDMIGRLFLSFFICGYMTPLLVISMLYILIMLHLKRNQMPQNRCQQQNKSRRTQMHAYKVIVVVIIVFGISWLPLHIHNIMSHYGRIPRGRFYEVLRILWHCMAYGNSLVNPFIYTLTSTEFRKSLKKLLCCYKKYPGNSQL